MRFESPWLLLCVALLVAAVAVWQLAERRRMRYAVRYPNVDVLASVVDTGRSWRRLVGPILFLEGLGVPSPSQLKDVVAFTLLVLVLVFRPQGILGERLSRARA